MSAERRPTITRQSLREWLQPAGAGDSEATEALELSVTGGPGDLVKIILDKLGIKPTRNCGCEAMRRQMNEWGYRGCWTNRAKLTQWFQARAAEAGISLRAATVTKLVGAALRIALCDRVR